MMSCSEVMYQAYYPYLYQRAAAAGGAPAVSAHHVPRTGPFTSPFGAAHQYDRFNVQRLQDAHSLASQGGASAGGGLVDPHTASSSTAGSASLAAPTPSAHPLYLQGSAHSSGGSVSSAGGGASPVSPLQAPRKEEDCSLHGRSSADNPAQSLASPCDDEDSQDVGGTGAGGGSGGGGSRAQYVSANCVVFTHYQGDASTVVDEHFSRALDKTAQHGKDTSPMSSRNFPPSFWNSQHYQQHHSTPSTSAADLYSEHYQQAQAAAADAWYHQYNHHHHHHRAVHEYHHHNMAAQYGGLLLPAPGSRLHAPCKAVDWGQHPGIESAYTSAYPTMSGLEAQVQDSSKDLYWF